MSELLTRIALYGDVLPLTFKLDYKKFKEGLNRWKICAKWLKKLPLLQGADGVEAKKVNQSRDL